MKARNRHEDVARCAKETNTFKLFLDLFIDVANCFTTAIAHMPRRLGHGARRGGPWIEAEKNRKLEHVAPANTCC